MGGPYLVMIAVIFLFYRTNFAILSNSMKYLLFSRENPGI